MTEILIYKIENTVDGKIYIGSTVNLKNRWKCHRTGLRSGKHHSKHLQFAFNKYGEDKFTLSIIESCEKDCRATTEQKWMDLYQSYNQDYGYNICPTAESVAGKKHSEETRAKMSKSATGRPCSEIHRRRISEAQKGKTYSDEYKKKMSEATKGRVISKETITKILAAKIGYKHSEQTKQKIREKATGRTPSKETRKKLSAAGKGRRWTSVQREKMLSREPYKFTEADRVKISKSRGGKQFSVISESGEIYEFITLAEARDKLGLDTSNIQKCLIGKAKQTKGYRCEYKNP